MFCFCSIKTTRINLQIEYNGPYSEVSYSILKTTDYYLFLDEKSVASYSNEYKRTFILF